MICYIIILKQKKIPFQLKNKKALGFLYITAVNATYMANPLTSLHTSMVPNTTCRPSKKLSPMRMTVAPPVVQPSLGLMAFMHGVAAYDRTESIPLRIMLYQTHTLTKIQNTH